MPPRRRFQSRPIRYGLFAALLLGVALLLLSQPPERSPSLFALLTLLALLLAGIDGARRAGLGPRVLLRRGRTVLVGAVAAWRAGRRAAAADSRPLAQTLAARLPWLQLAAEIALIVGMTAAVAQPYLDFDPATQLPGSEAEWLTSSAHFAADSLREYGYLPLWQPYLEFGEPLIDTPFSFVLNPISAGPSLLLGGVVGIKLSVALSALVAGLGGWVLGRVLGFGALGRLLLAALLIGKGNMHAMIGAGYYQLGTSQAYIPWVIAGALATLRLPARRWPVVLTAIAFTLLFWAGNIWYTLPTLVSVGLLALAHLPRIEGRGLDWRGLRRLALAGALTLGLSAITLLPIWLQRGQIGSHPDDIPGGRVVDLANVIMQFFDGRVEPYLNGSAPGGAYFYYSFVTPLWFALALLILIPPVWPLLYRPTLRQAWRVWLPGLLMIVLSTLWGAGGNPLFVWLYDHVPLLGQWRFVGRALGMASFWIAVLLALRVDGLWRALWASGWRTRLAPLVKRGLVYTLAATLIAGSAVAAQQVLAEWHTFAGTIGVNVYDTICLDWLRAQHPDENLAVYRPRYEAVTPFLTNHIRLTSVEADFTPLPLPATLGHIDLTQSPPEYGLGWDDFGRRYLSEHGYVPIPESPNPVDAFHCLWWRPGGALPYAYHLPLSTLDAAFGNELAPALVTPIETFRRYPDTIFLAVAADDATPRVVTIQERAYPGWQVSVDGAPARLESVGGQVGVLLPPDGAPHAITFAYRPPLLYLGGAITLLTWALSILYLLGADRALWQRWRKRSA